MADRSRTPAATVHHAACNLCEAICGITVTTADGAITDIRGDTADPLSRGHVCPKSVSLIDTQHDPDRLRHPMRRIGDRWVEIGWDEAISTVAHNLVRIREQYGSDAVAVYFGNPAVHSLGAMTHGTLFGSLLRTRNHFAASSVDQLPHHVVSWLLYGHQLLLPEPDLDRTSFLLMFGANPVASNGSMMTAPGMSRRLREIRERGGRVIVVDPRRTETAAVADEHVFIRPGTDAAVLLAMLNVILGDGIDELPAYVVESTVMRTAIAEFTPEVASRVSGVPAATIVRLAREFAAADGAACYGRIGVSTQRYGTLCHWAIQVLNIVTGNLGRAGGTLATDPAIDMTKLIGRGGFGSRRSRVRGLRPFAGELPVAVLAEEINTPGEGQVRALVTISGNPVLSTPSGAGLDTGLAGLDFMVAVDFYVNETTRHADIILPPTPALERDHYDLVFRALAVQNTAKYSPAVLPKPAGVRHDWEIFRDLGLAYQRELAGSRSRFAKSLFNAKGLEAQVRLRLSPRRLVDLLLRTGPYRLSVRKLRTSPSGLDLGALRTGFADRVRTKDRKIHLLPEMIATDLERLAADLRSDAETDPELPLRLIGRRHVRSNNSWGHNSGRLVAGKARHHLLMHPQDAARLGLRNGPALLRSAVGEIRVDVEQTVDIIEGTVSLPHGFGHERPGLRLGVAARVAGASINDITDPNVLDSSGNAAFCGLPVAVEPIRDAVLADFGDNHTETARLGAKGEF
ncbi:molybdopterin-dependent oxidoreductase [Nocardia lijiangensis]|uniref:molybdopterin-dependent oxidoreductase n=1 Tax=Nocardia lijiangensis TaxID=299618 RepID=UPI003D70F0AE